MTETLLLSVQKFSVHDGPGIRTTIFFKGCPLRCGWCHNPESQNFSAELLYDREKCSGCLACISSCPVQAIRPGGNAALTDRKLCVACGKCAEVCLSSARALAGAPWSEAKLLDEIFQDQVFYEQSGGGVTFSGGEALCRIDVLEALAAACKLRGLHVAVDTCGHVPTENVRRILPYTDLFLYDLKHLDPEAHRRHTGQDNRLILDNLRLLSDAGAAILLRLPLIEGVNADPRHIESLLDLVATLRIRQIHLLPYHNTGSSKYAKLGRASSEYAAPSPEKLAAIREQFAAAGLPTVIGG